MARFWLKSKRVAVRHKIKRASNVKRIIKFTSYLKLNKHVFLADYLMSNIYDQRANTISRFDSIVNKVDFIRLSLT